jgi:hypothetical protein
LLVTLTTSLTKVLIPLEKRDGSSDDEEGSCGKDGTTLSI